MSKFQTELIKKYEAEGYTVLKTIRLNRSGYPDLMLLKNGKVIWIESKEGKDTLKPLQKKRIDELRANGFEAFCLHAENGLIYPIENENNINIINILTFS